MLAASCLAIQSTRHCKQTIYPAA